MSKLFQCAICCIMGLLRFLVLSQEQPPGVYIQYVISYWILPFIVKTFSSFSRNYHIKTSSGTTSRWIYRFYQTVKASYNDHSIIIITVAGIEEASAVERVHKPAIKLPLLLPLEPITSNKLAPTRITDLFTLWQTSLPPLATSRTSAMPWRFPTLVRKNSW